MIPCGLLVPSNDRRLNQRKEDPFNPNETELLLIYRIASGHHKPKQPRRVGGGRITVYHGVDLVELKRDSKSN